MICVRAEVIIQFPKCRKKNCEDIKSNKTSCWFYESCIQSPVHSRKYVVNLFWFMVPAVPEKITNPQGSLWVTWTRAEDTRAARN